MPYLCVLTILLGSVMGDVSARWVKMGGTLLAQQAPPVFDNAAESSQALQPSAETEFGIKKPTISEFGKGKDKADGSGVNSEKPKDLEAYRQELKTAVDSGEMTEEAAREAWDDRMSKLNKQAGEEAEQRGKGWIEENLVFFLATVYGSIFLLVGTILLISYRVVKRREKARTENLQKTMAELGLDFEPLGDESLLLELSSLPLFNRGRGKKIANLIEADTADLQMQVFDYQFITGHGKNRKTHRTTVVLVRSETLVLPGMQVRPRKAFVDGIKAMFGGGGIAMDQYPEFAKHYVVESAQPDQTRDFLDAKMVAACERNAGCSFECQSGVLLHFRAGKRMDTDADSIRRCIGEGFQLFQDVSERLQRNA
jgi:hypothetical protein